MHLHCIGLGFESPYLHMEVDDRTMKMITDLLKDMYDLYESEDWDNHEYAYAAQNIITDGADIYADYFRNNN
jgi:hypothetical protein